jgi:DNA-directed RNA polymerase beta subunit
MATNMIDQAIPVLGAKRSVVHTSVNNLVYEKSDLNYKSDVDGVVDSIIGDYIRIKLNDGSYKILTAPRSIESSFHTYNSFSPAVKKGQRIKKGTILLKSDSFIGNELALTVPLKVAYFSYGAKTDEDAIIISDRASKLLAHKVYKSVRIEVPSGINTKFDKELIKKNFENSTTDASKLNRLNSILDKLNEFSLPVIGTDYNYKEFLSYYLQDQEDNTPLATLQAITKRSDDDTNLMKPFTVKLPPGLSEGTVANVRLFYKNTSEVINRYKSLINYYNNIHNDFIKSISDGIDGLDIPEYKINLNSKSDPDLVIIIDLVSINEAKIGDKLTNRFASKGTVSAVLPLDMMPRVGGRNGEPVDICMPPMSTINRKNLAQLIEMNLCELCKIAYNKVADSISDDRLDIAIEILNKLYVTDRFSNYRKSDIIRYHNQFDGSYTITVRAIDNVYTLDKLDELNKYFNYSDKGEKLYIPKYDCMTLEPINVGITEIMRLHFLPEQKAKATAINQLTHNDNMVMGIGAQKSDGQRIGRMETWALNAYDTLGEFNKLKGTTETNSYNDSINMITTSMKLLALDPRGVLS